MTILHVLPWATAAALALLVPWVAGIAGTVYVAFWAAAALPGVPLGRALFGKTPAGTIVGLAVGYACSCLICWALIRAGMMGPGAVATAWVAEVMVLVAAARAIGGPVVAVPSWTTRDSSALALTLLLVPVLMAAPYRNLGRAGEDGTKHYRAYFTADFVWHAALAQEVGRFEMPPRNPYMASEPLHYYWTYFLVPSTVASVGPPVLRDVEPVLKVNAIATATLLIASFFLLAWTAGAGPWAAALAVALVTVAASAEGFIAATDLMAQGRPLSILRNTNVDAMTAWRYNGLRIDGVHRTMLYTPQHGLSCALGLLALMTSTFGGARAPLSTIATTGVLLGLSATVNPFLGGAFSLIYGLAVLADAVRTKPPVISLLRHAVAAGPPVLALLWGTWNAMGEGAGDAVTFGWRGHARNAPVVTLLMSLGPVLVPAMPGLWPSRRWPAMPLLVATSGLIVGLTLLYFVVLSEASWVGFRAGQILIAILTVPLARLFGTLWARKLHGLSAALVAGIVVVGAPTVLVDTRNAADIANLSQGPGFPWTLTVTPGQQEALEWVRRHTPARAVVQMDALARGRAHWSFIPTFAGRRMATGLPISLLPQPIYRRRAAEVRSIFEMRDADRAHATARQLGIDYLWVDALDRQVHPDGTVRLATAEGYFERVFDNGEVQVYRVR
jgi:hypothetical protein